MNIQPFRKLPLRQREDHSEKGQEQFPSGLSTKTGSKLSFQLHLSSPSDEAELSQGPQNQSNPTLEELQSAWLPAATQLLSGVSQGCSLYSTGL